HDLYSCLTGGGLGEPVCRRETPFCFLSAAGGDAAEKRQSPEPLQQRAHGGEDGAAELRGQQQQEKAGSRAEEGQPGERADSRAGRPIQRPRGAGPQKRKQRRYRTTFSHVQLQGLEDAFRKSHYPDVFARWGQIRTLSLSSKVWFQNRRAKWRKQEKAEIPGNRAGISWTPPLGLYLDIPLTQMPLLDSPWRTLPISAVAVPPVAPQPVLRLVAGWAWLSWPPAPWWGERFCPPQTPEALEALWKSETG
uniref:Homeobox domain-containing protein n=1 Tax=Naja naja TaxID=35670 RepID=A0A8C6XSR1_NAJNA